ncbi:MAG: DUF5683 domain-containing protein [Bacteroidota bacterium]
MKSLVSSPYAQRLGLFLCGVFLLIAPSWSQVPDSVKNNSVLPVESSPKLIAPDTTTTTATLDTITSATPTPKAKKRGFIRRFLRDDFPNPKKALLLSIIPGGGQLYNRRYIKASIAIGGIAWSTYLIIDNSRQYRRFRDAHLFRVDGDDSTIDEFVDAEGNERLSANDLRQWRDIYQKNREVSYITTIGVFVLTAVEAFVDAHLRTFDVNEDLGMRLKPKLDWLAPNGMSSIGMGLVIEIGPRKIAAPKPFYDAQAP